MRKPDLDEDLTSEEGQAVDGGEGAFERNERKLSKCLQEFADRAGRIEKLLPQLPCHSFPQVQATPHTYLCSHGLKVSSFHREQI